MFTPRWLHICIHGYTSTSSKRHDSSRPTIQVANIIQMQMHQGMHTCECLHLNPMGFPMAQSMAENSSQEVPGPCHEVHMDTHV
jgi:hypothetical protein